jgi:hypothetical protein
VFGWRRSPGARLSLHAAHHRRWLRVNEHWLHFWDTRCKR